MALRPAVLVDVDGTLADVSSIRHYVRPAPGRRWKDFDAFHRESVNVPAHVHVVNIVAEAAAAGFDIVIVTARRARWRNHTAMWLALNDVPSHAMFMRADNDGRKDVEVKRDMLARIKLTWDPQLAIDDNPAILALWESEGIPTLRVAGWEYDDPDIIIS